MSAVQSVISELGALQRDISDTDKTLNHFQNCVEGERRRLDRLKTEMVYLKETLFAFSIEDEAKALGVPIDPRVSYEYFRKTMDYAYDKCESKSQRDMLDAIVTTFDREMATPTEIRAAFFPEKTSV